MTDPESVIRAIDLRRTYDGVAAVEGVSTEAPTSAVTAVVGPNGSGKTTLLRLLVGLESPSAGTVDRPGVGRIGYLPQRPAFRPGFTARETLVFYARLHGVDDDGAVDAVLDRVGLAAAAERRVEALSGGMVRLLGIAQALLGDPPFVVLDEPATGLDPRMRRHIFDVIDLLRDGGAGVVVASHDLELVEAFADRVLLLETGRCTDEGTVPTLLERYEVDSLEGVFEAAIGGEPTAVDVREVGR